MVLRVLHILLSTSTVRVDFNHCRCLRRLCMHQQGGWSASLKVLQKARDRRSPGRFRNLRLSTYLLKRSSCSKSVICNGRLRALFPSNMWPCRVSWWHSEVLWSGLTEGLHPILSFVVAGVGYTAMCDVYTAGLSTYYFSCLPCLLWSALRSSGFVCLVICLVLKIA